ncbi:MAG TPA: PAS domain S-box protein [Allosphingosinicella sp.]|nr:PAS domain S-box protein [Allosphingosinicella sp.]
MNDKMRTFAKHERGRKRNPSESLDDFFENGTVGLHLVAGDGTILRANRADYEPLGYTAEEYVGHHIAEFHADQPVLEDILARLSRGERLDRYPARLRAKDGSIRHVEITSSACFSEGAFVNTRCFTIDVSDRIEAAAALSESQARLELATQAAEIGIWDWDVASDRMTYSPRAKAICGFPPAQDITYEDARRVTHPMDYPRTSAMARRALDPSIRENAPYEYRILRPDGEVRWVLAHGSAVFEEFEGETKAVRYVGTLQDITERKRLEESERATARRLGLAISAGKMAVWELDLRNDELVPSAELYRLLGFPEGANPSTEELRARYFPGERERLQKLGAEALARGERSLEAEFRYCLPDDSVRWLWLRAEAVLDEDGKPARAIGVLMDINERKQAEIRRQVLVELGDRLRELEDPAELAFAAAETLGRALNVSRAGYGSIHPASETITIERDWTAPGVDSLAGTLRFRNYGSYIDNLKRGETVVLADARKDPRTAATADRLEAIDARALVNMPVSERGGLVALLYLNHAVARQWTADELALIREVAERTRTAVARREAEMGIRELNRDLERRVDKALAERKLWADVFESSDALIAAFAPGRRLLAFNASYAREFELIYGVPPRAGDSLDDLLAHMPDQLRMACELWDRALAGEEFAITAEFGDPERERPCYDVRFNTLRDRTGAVIGAFLYGNDVTERVRAEAKLAEAEAALRQSQKMEAMGQLTGGVAHDFNNLLTPIVGSLDLLHQRALGGERERRLIEGALQSAERAKTLVQRLLAFARRQPLQPRSVDLSELAGNMAELIASTSGPRVKVSVDVPPDLPPVQADPNQLEMAILNLAVNARDAMPDGGSLSIAACEEMVSDAHRSGLPHGRYIRLSVADTGIGMDEETLKRAVEPFFSTKGVGRGTGLGLSMVHGLAAQLGGAVALQSKPAVGTCVELWLPIGTGRDAAMEIVAESGSASAAGTVLLVDDEELIRLSTADMLGELGYAVVESCSAEEALSLVQGGLHFDLLVTDHLMPGMTGTDLARRLREARPSLPVLVVSGYAEADGVAPDLARLTKPFRRAELAAALSGLAQRNAPTTFGRGSE